MRSLPMDTDNGYRHQIAVAVAFFFFSQCVWEFQSEFTSLLSTVFLNEANTILLMDGSIATTYNIAGSNAF